MRKSRPVRLWLAVGATSLTAVIATGVSFASDGPQQLPSVSLVATRLTLPKFIPPMPEECTVAPDPTTNRGCLTPRTARLAVQLTEAGWTLTCWDEHSWNPESDHPKGRACDVFPGRGGQSPSAAEKASGDELADTLKNGAPGNNVNYIIWYGKIWSVEHSTQGWRTYDGGGTYNPQDIVGGHFDHLHISMF